MNNSGRSFSSALIILPRAAALGALAISGTRSANHSFSCNFTRSQGGLPRMQSKPPPRAFRRACIRCARSSAPKRESVIGGLLDHGHTNSTLPPVKHLDTLVALHPIRITRSLAECAKSCEQFSFVTCALGTSK